MTAATRARSFRGIALAIGILTLAIAIVTLGACVAGTPSPSPTGAALTPDQAAERIRTAVTGAKPLLILNAIPGDWKAEVRADANTFTATYRRTDGAVTVTLSIAIANLPLPGANALQTHPGFHGDARSLYQVADGRDPVSDRWLMWTETGTWSQPGPNGVPYLLTGTGLAEAEFWDFADSLHPNQI